MNYIYLVSPAFNYEGFEAPPCSFTDIEKAKKWISDWAYTWIHMTDNVKEKELNSKHYNSYEEAMQERNLLFGNYEERVKKEEKNWLIQKIPLDTDDIRFNWRNFKPSESRSYEEYIKQRYGERYRCSECLKKNVPQTKDESVPLEYLRQTFVRNRHYSNTEIIRNIVDRCEEHHPFDRLPGASSIYKCIEVFKNKGFLTEEELKTVDRISFENSQMSGYDLRD